MTAVLALLLSAPGISLEVEPGCACVSREALTRRLEQAGTTVGPGARLQVRIHKAAAAITVEAQFADGWRLTREVPAPANECPAVEQMVALLVASWTKDRRFVEAPPPIEEPPPAPRPTVKRAPRPAPPKPTAAATPEPEATEPVEAPVAVAPSAVPEVVAPPPAAEVRTGGPGIQLVARGGVNGRTPNAVLPAAELALTLTWSRFGLALSGGVSDATRTPLGAGTISTSAAWGSLGAATAIGLTERLSFEGALGVRLLVLSVASAGFERNSGTSLVSAGAFAEAGVVARVAGPLVVGLWGTAGVRPLEDQLTVANVPGHVVVPRWQFGLLAGMGLQWR